LWADELPRLFQKYLNIKRIEIWFKETCDWLYYNTNKKCNPSYTNVDIIISIIGRYWGEIFNSNDPTRKHLHLSVWKSEITIGNII